MIVVSDVTFIRDTMLQLWLNYCASNFIAYLCSTSRATRTQSRPQIEFVSSCVNMIDYTWPG